MINLAQSRILRAFTALGVTFLVVLGGLTLLGMRGRDAPFHALVVVIGFVLVVLVFFALRSVSRFCGHEPSVGSLALVGVVSGSVAFAAIAYALEGFEYGVAALLADPGSWVWLAGFCLGGLSLGPASVPKSRRA